MHFLSSVYEEFWNETHWFPPGANWTIMSGSEYPNFADLKLPIFYAFIVLAVRTAFEWSIARPLGRACGIKDTRSELPNFFKRVFHYFRKIRRIFAVDDDNIGDIKHRESNGCVMNGDVSSPVMNGDLSSSVMNGDVSSPSSYKFRSRSGSKLIHPRKSTLDKFSECCWRFTYYVGIFIYGLVILWNKPWFRDTANCWHGYPFQPITSEIWLYYMIELSFYWSLIFSQFVDVQRKDFWVNFIHHIATVLLMSFSWADNFCRVGTLVLLIHDAVDFWLEAAKMARYCKKNNICNILFIVFTATWFLTRCMIYPFWIIYSTLVEAPAFILFYRAYYVFNFLLFLLLILHIFWSIMILKIALSAVRSGEADDARSDSEDETDDTSSVSSNGKVKKT